MYAKSTVDMWSDIVFESLCNYGWNKENIVPAIMDHLYLYNAGISGKSSARTILLSTVQLGKWISAYDASAPYVPKRCRLKNVS